MIAVNISNSPEAQSFFTFFENDTTFPYNGSYESLLNFNRSRPLLGAIHVYSVNNVTIMYNDTCNHALPILMNVLNNVYDR